MARIAYNILDEDLLALFSYFFPELEIQQVGGEYVVPASDYQGYLDYFEAQLDILGDDTLWEYWDGIDYDYRIWSTETGTWV